MKNLLGAVVLTALSSHAIADNQFGFLIGGAITHGGDSVADYDFYDDDGKRVDSADLKAGELIHVYAGLYYRHKQTDAFSYGAQINAGYFFDSITADNGDATLSRVPLEFIPYIEYNSLRIGLGVTQHTSIEFEDDVDDGVIDGDIEFSDATGAVFLMEFIISPKITVGLRFVDIEYDIDYADIAFEPIDASHVGISVTGLF